MTFVDPVRLGPEGVPDLTIGWDVLTWTLDYLLQPDGPDAGEPWQYTDEQVRFILWWYAIDESGRWIYRRGCLRRMKGWGKDPLCASLAAVEMLGPCRFDGFDAYGEPVARDQASAWVQIAATSREQTKNTMTLFPGLFAPKAHEDYKLDLGKEIIHAQGGNRIESVTSSPRTLEGGRPSFLVLNETQHWLDNNEGHEMAKAVARNLAKSRGGTARSLAITNAHSPGEDSVAERDWDAFEAIREGRSKARGFLYDSLEAQPGIPLADVDALRAGLLAARGDSHWVDVDRLIDEIHDPVTPPSMSRRFYLNEITAAEDSWIAPYEWDPCSDPTLSLAEHDTVTLGFDGSIREDSTALVACRVTDGLAVLLGVWEKPDGPAGVDWQVDREAVSATIAEAMARYAVLGFYCDPAHWQDYIDRWTELYGPRMLVRASQARPLEWWTNRPLAMIKSLERFREAVLTGELVHDGGKVLRRHVLNAKNRVNPQGLTIAKEHPGSKHKIDAAMAATLAYEARADAVAIGLSGYKRRKRRAMGF